MLEEYKYKTELHAHTAPVSMCSQISPEKMVETYLREGYDTVAITNHFMYDNADPAEKLKFYLSGYRETKRLGDAAGLNIILGAEIRFSENENDYLIYGIDEDDLLEINSMLGDGIDKFYPKFKNDRNVLFQAHPFRNGMTRANPKSIDGVEVFNLHPGHNSRVGFAAKFARENGLLVSAGTDFHEPGREAQCSIMTREPILTSYDAAAVLKSQDFIVDISGYKVVI